MHYANFLVVMPKSSPGVAVRWRVSRAGERVLRHSATFSVND